ncbi:ATP-dependent DNA helicase RecG [Thermovibrio ammonificans]|uniref:ATP-dependent DNA helicase RecG n=1 Tax=Thermovibrio ammonificans (strain DSM 15698 / JCM 12110 / HB-1) TaxID=648996 RepID=E8T3K2_THEA1|nr:ATP-dependent DNA helicase RecG [Thermovibrio ammonificans]ADU96133.1 ATP-dependent DNA helicase RecG [Thermovibrio ammonificans HB-1]
MEKSLKEIKELLNLLTKNNFALFPRVKDPEKRLRKLFSELKPHLDRKRKAWVDKVLKLLDTYPQMTQEQQKRFLRELHSVITLKFTAEEIEKAREKELPPKERVVAAGKNLKRAPKLYPIEAFFQPVEKIKGITAKRVNRLKKLGIESVIDAIYYLPFRYEDRTTVTKMAQLKPDREQLVKGKVTAISQIKTKNGKELLKVTLYDKTGAVSLIFLNKKVFGYYKLLFEKAKKLGKEVLAYGKVKRSTSGFTIYHPEVEVLEPGRLEKLGRILPIYHCAEGLKQTTVRRDIHFVVEKVLPFMPEYLPEKIRKRQKLLEAAEAFWRVHFPSDEKPEELQTFRSPPQRRVIFDELFLFQLALALHRQKVKRERGIAFPVTEELIEEFKKALPFKLTGAQERVLKEIVEDMKKPEPMNRLVQGDVGSGKTVVAAAAAFFAAKSGYQTAVMAPTEILANQHYKKFKEFLKPYGITVGLLTGSMTKREKETVYRAIKEGVIKVVVGTHALIQEGVEFKNLGLVVIDEQHRFGVKQRVELKKKGKMPDVLVMTATPIPRTLAMTAYGDLDVSVIDELPAGRKPVKTEILFSDELPKLVKRLKEELQKGNRAYIVYPLVEESEKLELKAATEMHHFWSEKLKPYRVGLLHGKMKQEEKDKVMEAFKRGEFQVLVSTTVIEVGVDVPEATVMVIEHAERFGLAQLHQLRGRVGRGDRQSYCYLVTSREVGEEAIKRLKVLESTNDGFKIAEADLAFRGPGEIFGTRQSGLGDFKVADLRRDYDILKEARREAMELIKENPELNGLEELKKLMKFRFGEKFDLVEVG